MQDNIVPYFHITPFLARRRRNIMNLNPMAHSITRTLPKRPNQFRYGYPKLRGKPYPPKCERESIIVRATLDVAKEPQRFPRRVYYESMKRNLI
jgi:hypothetical protein